MEHDAKARWYNIRRWHTREIIMGALCLCLLSVYFGGNLLLAQRYALVAECAEILKSDDVVTLAALEDALAPRIERKEPTRLSGSIEGHEEVNLILESPHWLHLWVSYEKETGIISDYGLVYAASEEVDLEHLSGAGPRPWGSWPVLLLSVPAIILWILALWDGFARHRYTHAVPFALRAVSIALLLPFISVCLWFFLHYILI